MTAAAMRHVAGALAAPADAYDADVVILALDRPDETIAAIRSAFAQEGLSRHVFVVDQGSAPANLARLAAEIGGRPDATLVRLDRNLGVAGGRNRGSALGHGRVLAALDNDAEFADRATLARAAAVLDGDAGLAAVAFRIVVYETGGDDLSSWGFPLALLPRAAERFEVATFVGAGHAIRRAAWDDAGGYDDALFFCWEEFDFCLRAFQRGWRVQYHGDLVVRHKVSPEQRVTWSGTRWFYYVRNRLTIGRKWGASWPSLMPRYAAYLVSGLCNGVFLKTVAALPAAVRLSAGLAPAGLSRPARDYLRRTDLMHRGSPLQRLRREVLRRLPTTSS